MIYHIKKEHYDELLRIVNKKESIRIRFEFYPNDFFIEVDGTECNDNDLLYDFVEEITRFIADQIVLIIDEILVINENGLLTLEMEIGTDWPKTQYWDNNTYYNEALEIVMSVINKNPNDFGSQDSLDFDIELKGSKKSPIDCSYLALRSLDNETKEFVELKIEENVKSLIVNKLNDFFSSKMYNYNEETEYILNIYDSSIDRFYEYLPGKTIMELVIV